MSLINKVKNKYFQLPRWLLNFSGVVYYMIPQKIRYGKVFNNTVNSARKVEYASSEELEKMIDEKFVSVVKHAYYHVPFYKKLYDTHDVDIESISGVKDIDKLPFIDKSTVKEHFEEMIADDVDKDKLLYITTSGSTGAPVGFYQLDKTTMEEWAYTLEIWRRIGYKPSSSRLVLRGKKIHPASKNKNIFYDPLRRELSCNLFDMNDENMKEYCRSIETYKPEYIHGFMSAIIMLAKYIDKNNIKLKHKFKAVLATSESILDEDKKYVEKVFGARVFSFYGHSERLVIAGECEKSTDYHIEPLYGYCEILDEKGNKTNEGEMVATGFLNDAMPLIRYRTGDVARWSNDSKCSCGRSYKRIEKVIGRSQQDMLVSKDNTLVTSPNRGIHLRQFEKVIRYKIVQHEKGKVDMLLQVDKTFTIDDQNSIKKVLESRVDGKIEFNMKIVDNIPVLKNGKHKIIEQHIKF